MIRTVFLAAFVFAATATPTQAGDGIDALFSHFDRTTPGCALGIDRAGRPETVRAYGMGDLEHAVPIAADTIFEAGSVSKQFTAAAVLVLASEGKLALGDDIRKYLPEMPDYGAPITIDQLLNHTSGLRDWGGVEDIAGWPRTDRVYELSDVLAIASRQRALNYAPGTRWSYTNTGYNLLAIIVQRVSGKSLAAFTHERLFAPLGMTRTSWRDDFRRIVPDRAIAYSRAREGYGQLMPFENVYGNGGLLTTVHDLLTWNRALASGKLDPFVTAKLQEPAKLSDGRMLHYARGLFVEDHHGVREVSHAGATAGYRAWLGRFPDNGLSIALLCNASDAQSSEIAHGVADLYLPKAAPEPQSAGLPPLAEWYADARDGAPLHFVKGADGAVTAHGEHVTGSAAGVRIGHEDFRLLADGRLEGTSEGDSFTFRPEKAWTPSANVLPDIVGRYASKEAQAVLVVSMKDGVLQIAADDRPSAAQILKPAYTDTLAAEDFTVRVARNADAKIVGLTLSDSRVWNMPFARLP